MGETKYCLCCNEEVPFSTVTRDERIEVTCIYCGFTLDVKKMQEPQKPAEKGHALIADDSKYTRKIIEELLKEKEYSEHVQSFENGLMLISAARSSRLTSRLSISICRSWTVSPRRG
ncbi:MAG: hypothetical protein H6Q94_601 [Nitrospirae bacterium]|nr:hypothetical protein [Nitrospirota bacterium]